MNAQIETLENKIELAEIAMHAAIDSAKRSIAEIEGFNSANSFHWSRSVCESAKLLADQAIKIHKFAAIAGELRAARDACGVKEAYPDAKPRKADD